MQANLSRYLSWCICHSLGGITVDAMAHKHPNWFLAASASDTGAAWTKKIEKFSMPFMHELAANWLVSHPILTIELGNKGYLVGISPRQQDHNYTVHMNFSDFSTLQITILKIKENRRLLSIVFCQKILTSNVGREFFRSVITLGW